MFYQWNQETLNDADAQSLVDVLSFSVERFEFRSNPMTHQLLSVIKEYDGKGKCFRIWFGIDNDDEIERELVKEEAKVWANRVGWSLDISPIYAYVIMERTV